MIELVMRRAKSESGFTVVELMVVVLLLSLLLGVFYSFLFGAERASNDGQTWLDLNENARLSLERMSRELREADSLITVCCFTNGNPSGDSSIKFQSDFNASGSFTPTATYVTDITSDEVITYQYSSSLRQLLISTEADTTPVPLADNITSFRLGYFGTDPKFDIGCGSMAVSGCAAGDGIILWQEIDQSSFGNGNERLDSEVDFVTSVVIELTVGRRSQSHEYRTGIELRNAFS